ncbi:MAG: DUF971 domain-containing protein [Gallionella sp.]
MTEQPTEIILHQQARELEIAFADSPSYRLPYEFLRVHSPSAEVRGHGPGQEVLQVGKQDVKVLGVEPVGSYAMQISFDDGHDSGLYSWEYLRHLGGRRDELWQAYLQKLDNAGASRKPSVNQSPAPAPKGCGH